MPVAFPKPFTDTEETLYLVDISSFIFRAFFAIRGMQNSKGEPTNAVYGVAAMLQRMIGESKPKYLTVVYDSKEPSFRKEVYSEYKANRSEAPPDLIPQFDRIEALVRAMGIHSVRKSGIEADDLIGTLSEQWTKSGKNHRVVLVTGDKDLMQLVNERVIVWDTMKEALFGPPEVEAKFGLPPSQIRDYLALVGDSSDNIPGVPSIGPKSAVDLLKAHGDLEGIFAAAKAGKVPGKKGEVLKEHEKQGRLSQELATLKMDCDVAVDLAAMRSPFAELPIRVGEECMALLRELELKSLVEKWGAGASVPASADTPVTAGAVVKAAEASSAAVTEPPKVSADATTSVSLRSEFVTIDTEAKFNALLAELRRAPEFGFDLETTSLNPREARIVGIALAPDADRGYYVPVGHRGTVAGLEGLGMGTAELKQLPLEWVMERLRPLLEDPTHKKIGQNLKYDFSVLVEQDVRPDGIGADTMVADYLLEPEGRHNLETVSRKYLDYQTTNYEDICGKGKDQITFDLVPIDVATRYSAEDAWAAMNLWRAMRPKLEEKRLMRVFAEVDLPLVPVLVRMEGAGVSIDVDYLKTLGAEFSREILRINEEITKYAKNPVNLNSPKQLAQLLFEELKLPPQGKTKTGFSTDASVLEALAPLHAVPKLILEHREVAKLMGTYVEPLPQMRDAKTGKIHAGFHQTVAATGRLSSSDPNLQNIPVRTKRGQMIRRAFVASEGNFLVSADYSQIELRLLAQMSGDADLVDSFRKNEDVHRRTASEIYGVKPADVTDEQRGVAKAINFGLMYGKTAFGLAAELGISRGEAKEMIDKYFRRYHGVKSYLDHLIIEAKETGVVSTLLGRRRELRDIKASNPAVRANAERMAMNTPIQGTAADLMKLAMIRLDERLAKEKLRSKLIIQVHDEVVLDAPEKELAKVKSIVVEAMEGAFDGLVKLDVPLKTNVAYGRNWMDLEDL